MSGPGGLEGHLRGRLAARPVLLMTHLVAGYPSLDANWQMLQAMDEAGADVVELQLPFSEPIADGPTFVKANQDAIGAGIRWREYFDLAARASSAFSFATLFMGYYNSVFAMGEEAFCGRLRQAGMSGFIIPDLPPEDGAHLSAVARGHGLDPVLIMTPANSPARLAQVGRQASGMVYCTARTGVTGRQTDLSQGVTAFIGRCRTATPLPLGLGFGIKTAADVASVRGLADVAIVGTAGTEAWLQRGPDGYRQFLKSLAAETLPADPS